MIGFEMGQVQGWVRFLVGRPAYQLERVGGWGGGGRKRRKSTLGTTNVWDLHLGIGIYIYIHLHR